LNSNKNLYNIIKQVIDKYKDTQINIGSDSARADLTRDIHDAVDEHIKSIIEDVCVGTGWEDEY
jgi:hypothetical protein